MRNMNYREAKSSNRKFCPHCAEYLTKCTYFRHRRKYCDRISGKWEVSTKNYHLDTERDHETNPESALRQGETLPGTSQKKSKKTHSHGKEIYQTSQSVGGTASSSMKHQTDKERIRYQFCPHCQDMLSKSQFFRHKKKFFDKTQQTWILKGTSKQSGSKSNDVNANEKVQVEEQMESCGRAANILENDLEAESANEQMSDGSPISDSEDLGVGWATDTSTDSSSDTDIGTHSDGDPEIWDENPDPRDDLLLSGEGIALQEPPEAVKLNTGAIKSMVTWILYFILLWQYKYMIADNAIESLLKFVKCFVACMGKYLSEKWSIEFIAVVATYIPSTLYTLYRYLGIDRDNFTKFAVCDRKSCHQIHKLEGCIYRADGQIKKKTCDNLLKRRGKLVKCGNTLVKEVVLNDGKTRYYPKYVYCYKSIILQLETFLQRPGFKDKVESWRKREHIEGAYGDIYDGKVWKDFLNKDGKSYLKEKLSLGLMLNVDWFSPFKRRKNYSVGVLYMTVMNLTREERFLKENVLLVGILPALNREPDTLNPFLNPLVNELKLLWKGVPVNTHGNTVENIKAALLCCSSDIPAARKLCGFIGHSANRGCSHYYTFFPGGFGEEKDYTNLDRESFQTRTDNQHRRDATRISKCKTVKDKQRLESRLGTRYTTLLELPYYGSITMCAIDPMHNLFLGTAKHTFETWINTGLLTKEKLKTMQDRMDSFSLTSDLGRLPGSIEAGYAGWTAAQWKNFVMYYSLYSIEKLLPDDHIHCWQNFVIACRYLCQPYITQTDLQIADRKLLDFLKGFKTLYGKDYFTINLHLHLHLKSVVENYGPVYGFWLFTFERYNGILGEFSTNCKSIEVQLMRKFLSSTIVYDKQFDLPCEFYADLFPACETLLPDDILTSIGRLSFSIQKACMGPITGKELAWLEVNGIQLPRHYKMRSFDQDDMKLLERCYECMYPNVDKERIVFAWLYRKYGHLTIGKMQYGSFSFMRLRNYSGIVASWLNDDLSIGASPLRAGDVMHYLQHTIFVDGKAQTHLFAMVRWLKKSNTNVRNPLKAYKRGQHEDPSPASFIPVQRIYSRYIWTDKNNDHFICPLVRKFFI